MMVHAVMAARDHSENEVLRVARKVSEWSGAVDGPSDDEPWVGEPTMTRDVGVEVPHELLPRLAYWRNQGYQLRVVACQGIVIGALAVTDG